MYKKTYRRGKIEFQSTTRRYSKIYQQEACLELICFHLMIHFYWPLILSSRCADPQSCLHKLIVGNFALVRKIYA